MDSGAFIARAVKNDGNHEAARRVFQDLSQRRLPYRLLYTSNFVVDEVLTFLLYRTGARTALAVLAWIRGSPNLRVLHVSEEAEALADREFRRYASSRVSYTDCTTKVLMEQEAIDTAFAFDRDLEVLGFHRVP
ncbi:MAG: type II toxin-antitoxin system VapC family toxin [Methanobacteriota archaeon]